MNKHICVVITARPSYSRVKSLLFCLKSDDSIKLSIVVAGSALSSKYGKVVDNIVNDGFSVAKKISTLVDGGGHVAMVKTTGLGVIELGSVFDEITPNLVVTIADRFETLATAIAASYMNIPLLHIQGGEVSGSIDQKVRNAVTQLSDIHFVATKVAAKNVISMGVLPSKVYVTGCPSLDLVANVRKGSGLSFNLEKLYGGVGGKVDTSGTFLIVLLHPDTTEAALAEQQTNAVLSAIDSVGLPTIWFWPNIDAGSENTSKALRKYREKNPTKAIRFFKNISPEHFLELARRSGCVLGNSSVAVRECSFLGVPAVNIGNRQNNRERGPNIIDVPFDWEQISIAIKSQLDKKILNQSHLYGDGKAGLKMAKIIKRILEPQD